MAIQDVDGIAELLALVLGNLAAFDEGLEVRVGIGGGVEGSGGLLEVGDEEVCFVDVWDGAAGGAGDAADHALGAALAEHLAGVWIIGVDDDAIGDVAAELGIWMSGWVEDLGVNSADAFFRVAGLDVGVAIFGDADAAHCEEAGRGLSVSGAKAALSGAAAEGLLEFAGFE